MNYDLLKETKLKGHWWLFNKSDNQVRGELIFKPFGNGKLYLEGIIHNSPFETESENIYGSTFNGEKVTLFDAHISSFGFQDSSAYSFNSMYVGESFIENKNDLFVSMILSFSHLESWFDFNPIKVMNITSDNKQPETIVERRPAKPFITSIDSLSTTLKIFLTNRFSLKVNEVYISNSSFILIRPKMKKSLKWFEDIAFSLRQLLTMLYSQRTNIRYIKLCKKKHRVVENHKIRYDKTYDYYLFHQSGEMIDETDKVHPRQIPFTLGILKKSLPGLLNNWFNENSPITVIKDLFFFLTNPRSTPIEFSFLLVLQALEAYDRNIGNNKYMKDKDYVPIRDSLISELPSSLSPSHKESLKNRIKYGNEYSLRKRITGLLNQLPKNLRLYITENDKNFVAKVIDTRNYLIHRDEDNRGIALKVDYNFVIITNKLVKLLYYYLLFESGIPKNRITEDLYENHFYKLF